MGRHLFGPVFCVCVACGGAGGPQRPSTVVTDTLRAQPAETLCAARRVTVVSTDRASLRAGEEARVAAALAERGLQPFRGTWDGEDPLVDVVYDDRQWRLTLRAGQGEQTIAVELADERDRAAALDHALAVSFAQLRRTFPCVR